MTVNKLEPDNGTPNDELFTVAGMFDGSLYKLLLRMALPMFVGMLTQVTYAIADIFWLSHIDVTNSGIIAGVGLVFPVGMGLFAIANGIQIGMGSLLSRAIGMQRLDRAQRILSVGIIIALFFAIVITVLGYVYAQPLLRSLGATKSIIGYATEFYYYSLLTVFSIMLIGVMMGLFQGAGKIMVIMKASLLGALVNIMLDPIMIFVFDFGVKGVALASFLAQLSMVAYFIYTLMGLHIGLSIRIALRPFSWKIYREFLSVGMAQMLMQLIIAVGIVIYKFFYRQAGRKRDGSVYAHWSHRLFHHHADAGYRDRVADCGGAKLGTRKCHPHAECLLGRRRAGLLYCAGVSRYAYCTGTLDVSPVYSCCCRE